MNRTSLVHALTMVAALVIAAFATPASAQFVLDGAAADRTSFITMLNSFSTGGAWKQVGADNELAFTADGKPLNNFATKTKGYNDGSGFKLTLEVGRNQPGVLVGSFMGGGIQRLDLTDIATFSDDITFKPKGDFQQAILLHELAEVYTAVNRNLGYDASHRAAIDVENAQIKAMGALGERDVLGVTQFLNGNPLNGFRPEIRSPWTYHDPAGDIKGFLSIKIGNANILSDRFIRGGLFDFENPFDPATSEDVWIESYDFVPEVIPAPGASALLGLGMGFAVRRRRTD
ncbi:MAG: PEP-CTERM sorting domain-containing protein [Planctomycetes bacterium]|nr:PEP-CTERM sorting domain-containing protein [Planctomycetota bacterium]